MCATDSPDTCQHRKISEQSSLLLSTVPSNNPCSCTKVTGIHQYVCPSKLKKNDVYLHSCSGDKDVGFCHHSRQGSTSVAANHDVYPQRLHVGKDVGFCHRPRQESTDQFANDVYPHSCSGDKDVGFCHHPRQESTTVTANHDVYPQRLHVGKDVGFCHRPRQESTDQFPNDVCPHCDNGGKGVGHCHCPRLESHSTHSNDVCPHYFNVGKDVGHCHHPRQECPTIEEHTAAIASTSTMLRNDEEEATSKSVALSTNQEYFVAGSVEGLRKVEESKRSSSSCSYSTSLKSTFSDSDPSCDSTYHPISSLVQVEGLHNVSKSKWSANSSSSFASIKSTRSTSVVNSIQSGSSASSNNSRDSIANSVRSHPRSCSLIHPMRSDVSSGVQLGYCKSSTNESGLFSKLQLFAFSMIRNSCIQHLNNNPCIRKTRGCDSLLIRRMCEVK